MGSCVSHESNKRTHEFMNELLKPQCGKHSKGATQRAGEDAAGPGVASLSAAGFPQLRLAFGGPLPWARPGLLVAHCGHLVAHSCAHAPGTLRCRSVGLLVFTRTFGNFCVVVCFSSCVISFVRLHNHISLASPCHENYVHVCVKFQ